jgi:hypothetical protein
MLGAIPAVTNTLGSCLWKEPAARQVAEVAAVKIETNTNKPMRHIGLLAI